MAIMCDFTKGECINKEGTCKECEVHKSWTSGAPKSCIQTIGIPLLEVGERLEALDKSLRQNGMALKADTGVHIDCSRSKTALGFTLEVVVFAKEKENEQENE